MSTAKSVSVIITRRASTSPSKVLFNRPLAPGTILGRAGYGSQVDLLLPPLPLRLKLHAPPPLLRHPPLLPPPLALLPLALRLPPPRLRPPPRLAALLLVEQASCEPRVGLLLRAAPAPALSALPLGALVLELARAAEAARVGEKGIVLGARQVLVPGDAVREAEAAVAVGAGHDGRRVAGFVDLRGSAVRCRALEQVRQLADGVVGCSFRVPDYWFDQPMYFARLPGGWRR
jgi:hypothetical protein